MRGWVGVRHDFVLSTEGPIRKPGRQALDHQSRNRPITNHDHDYRLLITDYCFPALLFGVSRPRSLLRFRSAAPF